MAVFAVVASNASPELLSAIERVYGKKSFRFASNVWFVVDAETSKKVCEKLGVQPGGITGVVVMPFAGSYYGVSSTELWEWLRAAFEGDLNG